MTPPAVLSFDATTATTLLPAFLIAAAVSCLAFSAAHPSAQGSSDHLDRAGGDAALEHLHLPLTEQLGVVVGGRAADEDVVALRGLVEQVLRLHPSDLHVVERHVEGDVGVADQAVVADHRHLLLARGRDDGGGLLGVDGHDDEHERALGEGLASLLLLKGGVAVGCLHDHVGVQFLHAFDEQVAVALPPLFGERVEQQGDGQLRRLELVRLVTAAAARDENREGQQGAGKAKAGHVRESSRRVRRGPRRRESARGQGRLGRKLYSRYVATARRRFSEGGGGGPTR